MTVTTPQKTCYADPIHLGEATVAVAYVVRGGRKASPPWVPVDRAHAAEAPDIDIIGAYIDGNALPWLSIETMDIIEAAVRREVQSDG